MKTYYPTWSLKTKALSIFSILACLGFSVGVFFIGKSCISNAIQQRSTESFLLLIFPVAFLVGLTVWAYGILDLQTKRFILDFDSEFFSFKHEGGPMKKERKVRISEIKSIRIAGSANYGVWLVIQAGRKSHRLGHLLKPQDAFDIESEIHKYNGA